MALVVAYPKACVAYKKWQKRQFAADRKALQMAIRIWLAGEKEPTTAGFQAKFGRSPSFLAACFPSEYREVVERASKRRRLIRERRIEATREEVFRVVRELRQKNVYPSVVRVSSLLGRDCMTARRVVRSAIADAMRALGWNNRLDRTLFRITPFASLGIANTISDSHFFFHPFTTLGLVGHFEGGADYKVWDFVSVGASFYDDLPSGQQKVFSKLIKRQQKAAPTSRHRAGVFESAHETTGSADIDRDNGFSGWVDASNTSPEASTK